MLTLAYICLYLHLMLMLAETKDLIWLSINSISGAVSTLLKVPTISFVFRTQMVNKLIHWNIPRYHELISCLKSHAFCSWTDFLRTIDSSSSQTYCKFWTSWIHLSSHSFALIVVIISLVHFMPIIVNILWYEDFQWKRVCYHIKQRQKPWMQNSNCFHKIRKGFDVKFVSSEF